MFVSSRAPGRDDQFTSVQPIGGCTVAFNAWPGREHQIAEQAGAADTHSKSKELALYNG